MPLCVDPCCRELLQDLINVYLNLASADREGALAAAIAADTRSYEPSMFPEAARVGGCWCPGRS
jgi:hypothetical protein